MIDELVKFPKEINRKKKPQFRIENRNYRMDIPLSAGLENTYLMFIRKLVDFPEDFSVGLLLKGPSCLSEADIVLVRFQGPHGGQSVTHTITDLHNSYHIHYYSEDDANHRRRRASTQNKYGATFNSIESAIVEFLDFCNIKDPNGIFDEEKLKASAYALNIGELE